MIDFSKVIKDYKQGESKSERMEILRTKVKTVARMQRIFKNLRYSYYKSPLTPCFYRSNSEMLIAIKKQSSDGKIPKGLLMNGTPAIKNAFSEFEISKQLDRENEKFPTGKTPTSRGSNRQ